MTLERAANQADMNVVQFRIERGDQVVGSDGVLGTVEQIVVERDVQQLRSLIIRATDSPQKFELPADRIVRTLEHQVEMNFARADLSSHPELATPYDPSQFVPIFTGARVPDETAGRVSAASDRPVVTGIESDAAELISARTDIAPEGEVQTVSRNQSTDQTVPGASATPDAGQVVQDAPVDAASQGTPLEDRIVEPPKVVPVSETPPATHERAMSDDELSQAASLAEGLRARVGPPTPVSRQIATGSETSEDEVTAAEVSARTDASSNVATADELEDIELSEQVEPFFVTDEELLPAASIAWGAALVAVGLAAAGIAVYAIWRSRNRAKANAAVKAGGLALKMTGWQARRQARHTIERSRGTLTDTLNAPLVRLRWFGLGARAGRTLEANRTAAEMARMGAMQRLTQARLNALVALSQVRGAAADSLGQAKMTAAGALARLNANGGEQLDVEAPVADGEIEPAAPHRRWLIV
jgi:hypothetical protein